MALIPVRCPYCQSTQVIKGGKTDTGTQRSRGHNPACSHQSFWLDPAYKGRSPEIKQQVLNLSRNGSGVRDTALSQTLDADEQYYHFLLSIRPTHRTALREFGTQFRWSPVVLCEWHA
jgi:transposase-like protein